MKRQRVKCGTNLVLAEAADGAIILANDEGTDFMKWSNIQSKDDVPPKKVIKSKANGKVFDVEGAIALNGIRVIAYPDSSRPSLQEWEWTGLRLNAYRERLGYSIALSGTGFCLDRLCYYS